MKNKIQIAQNKCIRYCLQPDKMTYISKDKFETLNLLPAKGRFNEFINSIVFKYFTKQWHIYLDEVFELTCPNNLLPNLLSNVLPNTTCFVLSPPFSYLLIYLLNYLFIYLLTYFHTD